MSENSISVTNNGEKYTVNIMLDSVDTESLLGNYYMGLRIYWNSENSLELNLYDEEDRQSNTMFTVIPSIAKHS